MNWSDINIKQWYDISRIQDLNHKNDYYRRLAVMLHMEGRTGNQSVSVSDLKELNKKYAFLDEEPRQMITQWDKYEFVSDVKDVSFGQFVDMMESSKGDKGNNFHVYMSIMSKPMQGGIEDHDKRSEYFLNNMPIEVAFGHTSFFLQLSKRLDEATKLFLKKEMTKQEMQMKWLQIRHLHGFRGLKRLARRLIRPWTMFSKKQPYGH